MSGGHGEGGGGGANVWAYAVVAVAVAATIITLVGERRQQSDGYPQTQNFSPLARNSIPVYRGNPNADIVPPGFSVRHERY